MRACESAFLAFASCIALACAEGYPTIGSPEAAALIPSAGGSGGAGGVPSSGGMGGMSGGMGGGGMGGMGAPSGEPCTQNDVRPCPCEGSAEMGERICVFNMASPTQGFFSDECRGCPAAMPMPSCTDAMHNGAETGVDCGGPECMPCSMSTGGSGGSSTSGGSGGEAGASGESGSSGESGAGGDEPTEPVEDCDGVPEGTECDRRCILPGNTARCNENGECSCLN